MLYNKEQCKEIKNYLDNSKCARCFSSEELTLDHIIPISFLMQNFGASKEETYDWDNFQPLCRKCNTLKAGRFDLSNEKTKKLLLKYIEIYCK